MTALVESMWLVGFAAALAWVARAFQRARAEPDELSGRGQVAAAAIAIAALGFGAAHVWGIGVARAGMARIVGAGDDGGTAATPARARLFLRAVQLPLARVGTDRDAPYAGAIGYSPDAALRLPRAYGLDESKRGWDLVRVTAQGPQGLTVTALEPPEPTATRVRIVAERLGAGARSARAIARSCATDPGAATATLDGPGSVRAVLCHGATARAALIIERDLPDERQLDSAAVRVVPQVWNGARWRPHHVQIARGSLMQIGAATDALPGVTLWEVPAPAGRAELFFPPDNLLAPCGQWLPPGRRVAPGARASAPDDPVCVMPFSPPFGLEVRRLLPDMPSIAARSVWAAGLAVTPALLLLMVLASRPRSAITRRRWSYALALGWLSALVAALGVSRLLWAHRVDMLRDYQSVGPRVLQNQTIIVLASATLAAAAALAWFRRRPALRHVWIGAAAWAAWVVVGGYAMGSDLGELVWDARLVAQLGLSLAIGTAPAWSRLVPLGQRDPWRVAAATLGAIAVACIVARWGAPRAVALKLGFAWAIPLAAYAALRACVGPGGSDARRVSATLAFAGFAVIAAATYDAGVATVIAAPGVAVAIIFAGHDARYADASVKRMSAFRRHCAPLVIAQAVIAASVGLAVIGWATVGLVATADGEPDGLFASAVTFGAIHAVALLAALVLAAGVLTVRRAGWRAAAPWLVASALLLGAWALRGPVLDRVLAARPQAANRIALVADPGYALLRSETKFLSGITAWREAIAPAGDVDLANGQGYFGAQLIDPGVLLSVENDYFPVLLVRETGVRGVVVIATLLIVVVVGLWSVAGARFRHGSVAQRSRVVATFVLGVLCVYQPLAALGVLPLTGISWPGFGLDSPSDFWLLIGLAVWIALTGAPDGDDRLDELDAQLRTSRPFVRVRRIVVAAAAVLAVASLVLLWRASAFALRRPNPVDERGRAVPPFDSLAPAVDYAYQLQCPWDKLDGADAAALVPRDLLANPRGAGPTRFHRSLRDAWASHRGTAVRVARAFLAGETVACRGARGPWRFEHSADAPAECRMRFKTGWPEVRIAVERADTAHHATCDVAVSTQVLRQLRLPVRRPYRDERIRVVSRAMGDAARDAGELVSGHVVVRLRPGAGDVDVSAARPGMYAADRVAISDQLSVEIAGGRAVLRFADAEPGAAPQPASPLLFVRDPTEPAFEVLRPDRQSWRRVPAGRREQPLDSMAVVVVGGDRARSLWLFRPSVDPLLADDIATVRGERRRHYLYGGLLPELGWVNPYSRRNSLGLDGWVHVAMREYDNESARPRAATWIDDGQERAYCGTLAPPAESSAARVERVCARSPLDGVLECGVSLQPELSIRLSHLTQLIALRPQDMVDARRKSAVRPALRADYVLLRGDTGEIAAHGEFVPGRASSAYAPATPEIEQHLIRLREDRDPRTGRKLSASARGEHSSEKIEWPRPIAVGSTIKPMLGRALEQADPRFARTLRLSGSKQAAATCGGKRRRRHALLGHCPPTDSLWNLDGTVDLAGFVAESVNWVNASIGLLGTAVPNGAWGFGADEAPREPSEVVAVDVGSHATSAALWTRHRGANVVFANHTVDIAALRETAMWRAFERVLGRPLCALGSKRACRQDAYRADLCAARALPIDEPTRDLRHLVSLGPGSFDFYPSLADRDKTVARVNTREYFQFLRGSGLHPIGSLAQIADAFNRVVYEPMPTGGGGHYRLAASWFPVAVTGQRPNYTCRGFVPGSTVAAGLCGAVRTGSARALGDLLQDDRIEIYGVKTGTIDSLADLAERDDQCKAFRTGHTIPDRPATAAEQPYWLECKRRATGAINDSLIVVSFGVKTRGGAVPLTLAVRFQRGGVGLATAAARHYIEAIRDYFALPEPAVGAGASSGG